MQALHRRNVSTDLEHQPARAQRTGVNLLRAILLSRLRLFCGNPEGNSVISSTGASFAVTISGIKVVVIKLKAIQVY